MSQSLAKIVLHIAFSTKHRQTFLVPEIRGEMEAYLVGTLQGISCPSIRTRCQADHVHIVCCLSKNRAPADVLEEIKKASSKWIKTKGPQFASFFWQGGYGVFSVSPSNLNALMTYLDNQDEHHKKAATQGCALGC
jgi:putative transposase